MPALPPSSVSPGATVQALNSPPYPITPGAGFTAEIPFFPDYTVQPEQLGITQDVMDDLIAYNDKLARLSMHDPLYRETGGVIGQPAVDLGPGIPDQYHTLGGQLTAEFSPLPTEDLISKAKLYQRLSSPFSATGADANVQGIMRDRGDTQYPQATGIINDAIREDILQIPPPDYNLMDRLSAAYQYLAPTSRADPSRQQEAAEVLFREAEASPVVREEALRRAPSAVLEAIRNRDISRLPTYEPIIPAFTGGSIAIPEELPPDIPFPERVEDLPVVETPVAAGPRGIAPRVSAPPQEEEVSEKRVKEIKKKPKEKRTSVEEQVVVASEVKKALDNASKGKKVKNELKAIVELAKVDPTIVKRYTTPGSQALQDITAQVDSFSFMPTIQKKKKQPVVDPWAFEDRRGGRR